MLALVTQVQRMMYFKLEKRMNKPEPLVTKILVNQKAFSLRYGVANLNHPSVGFGTRRNGLKVCSTRSPSRGLNNEVASNVFQMTQEFDRFSF